MTPDAIAALLGGIRIVEPNASVSHVEALMHIATGADCAVELSRRMFLSERQARDLALELCGRGRLGKTGRASRLHLIDRRRHPDRPTRTLGLLLSANGRELIAATFPNWSFPT